MKITKNRIIEIAILLGLLFIGIFGIYKIYYHAVVKPNLYTITFHDIDSIIKGSPVRFMGIIVGHVRNLQRKDDVILCEIFVTKPHTKIPDGALAKVEYNGLGGSKSIEIMPPKTENPDVKGIVATEALRINDMMEAFSDLREVLACIKQFVEGITPESTLSVTKAIADMPDFTADANKALDDMAKKQAETHKKFKNAYKFQKEIENLIDKILRIKN